MSAMKVFYEYMGTGTVLIWYLLSVFWLFFREKKKPVRICFLYAPLVLLLLFFNPLFARLFERFLGGEIYYRTLWLLPMTPTLSYVSVRICMAQNGRRRAAAVCAAALLILLSGKLMYSHPAYSKAENVHHVPQVVAELCDRIKIDGREVIAAFPEEHLNYVRQYSPIVCMPYGREVFLYQQGEELYQALLQETLDVERVAALAKERGCHYVIFSEKKQLDGRMEEYEYELFGQVGDYLIYRDTTMNFSTVPQE